MPHDVVFRNGKQWFSHGRSTGCEQQQSDEAVEALTPGLSGGWGPMADTMNPAKSIMATVVRLKVTTNGTYTTRDGSVQLSPIAADVLRVQGPPLSSAVSGNYSAAQVELAQRMARGGPRFWTEQAK